jgi:hypothetical protein
LPLARDAYRIGAKALPRGGRPHWFRWLIPRETVATLTVDSLPTAINVKGNIEFEAVRMFPRFGEPVLSSPDSPAARQPPQREAILRPEPPPGGHSAAF